MNHETRKGENTKLNVNLRTSTFRLRRSLFDPDVKPLVDLAFVFSAEDGESPHL